MKLHQHLSMRASLSLTIVIMGLLGLVLALATGEVYRQRTLENQRAAMANMLRLKADDLLRELEVKSRDLALAIQQESEFQRAFAARDTDSLSRLMNRQFHQYFETANIIRLEKLMALDADLSFVAESTEGGVSPANGKNTCQGLIRSAGMRQGAARLKPVSDLCAGGGHLYHAVIVPVGGLRPHGYLMIVTDPVQVLAGGEAALGLPLRIALVSGELLYTSPHWLPLQAMERALVAEYPLQATASGTVATLGIMDDMRGLQEKLSVTRYMVMMVAGLITLLVIAIALLVLQNTTLRPLMALHDKLRSVRKDRTRLSETLAPSGTLELRELAQDFNAMSAELGDVQRMLKRQAFTDMLTELPNRSHFHECLRQCTTSVRPSPEPFALFVMDLDRFKEVNDSFGHDIGDQLLRQASGRLHGVLRRSDLLVRFEQGPVTDVESEIIARLGGDEFAAIMPGVADEESAIQIARKFIKAMQQPFHIGLHRFNVGISIGVALYPRHGSDPMTLLRQADVAMYQAKQEKSGHAFFDSVRDHQKLQLLTLERDLRQAIESGSLELHFQPIVDIRTTIVSGVEALVRWRYPERDLLPPERFIHIAEQCGLIQPLTRWVLNRAVEQCVRWRRTGYLFDVSVNLSVMNLHEPDLVDYVMDTLRRWQAEPSWLTLELTESAVMSDPNHALEVLSRLDAMGVRISIDDFGTGYSSLAYLKRLPVDEIKIDRSFVMDMKLDNNDAVIVRSTIDLAHNMSLRVVAEGVENPETLQLLTSLGCDVVQGFFVSQPLPYDELIRWLGSSAWSVKQRPGYSGSSVVSLRRPRPAS